MQTMIDQKSRRNPALRPGGSLATALTLLLAAGVVAGCGGKREARPEAGEKLPPVSVTIQAVQSGLWTSTEEVVGTIRARLRATMEAKISGRISEMPVILGQQVKQGQLLARLDAPESKARLQSAQAELQQARREWERSTALVQQQAISRSESDLAESRHLTAKAAVAEAQAMMAYAEVLAPFDGVVTRKWADVGDLAAPGKALLDIEDPTRMQLQADVPEALVSSIKDGSRMAIIVDALREDLSGTVSEISPAGDSLSRTFQIKLDVPGTPGLRSGQFARLLVPIQQTTTLRAPDSAVVKRGQMDIVFTVEGGKARMHLVKLGRRLKGETEILSGLDSGDKVVTSDAALLVDGQPVTLK
jgi:RND family efflux transporter MFP subunit